MVRYLQLTENQTDHAKLCYYCLANLLNVPNLVVGIPDPPTNVGYDESVVIVSSVDLEWIRPSYTGSRGVSVTTYTVSANGGTVVVSDDSEVVRYTSQSLIY